MPSKYYALYALGIACFISVRLQLKPVLSADLSHPAADENDHGIFPSSNNFQQGAVQPTRNAGRSSRATAPQTGAAARKRSLFEPGSLSLSKSQTIERCHVGTRGKYEGMRSERIGSCVYSEKHNIILVISGKTGSSTQRQVMLDSFDGVGGNCGKFLKKRNARYMVATRDPLDRFISAYKEMTVRLKLYKKEIEPEYMAEIPTKYRRFANELKALDGDDRVRMLRKSTPSDVIFNTRLMETFIDDYDGANPFDGHLAPQMNKLWSRDREVWAMNRFDIVLETANLTAELAELARREGARPPQPLVARKSMFDMIDATAVSNSTTQKICRLSARDYCCLNYKLPPACLRDDILGGERVMCEWVPNEEGDSNAIKAVLL